MNPTSLLSGLGTAVSAEPTLGGVNGTGRAPGSGTADLFMALVAGLLDSQGAGAPGGATTAATDAATQTDGEPVPGMPVTTGAKGEQPAEADLADLQPDAADVVAVPMAVPMIVQPAVLTQAVPAAGGIDASAAVGAAGSATTTAASTTDLPSAGADADGQDAGGQDAGGDAGTPGAAPAPAAPSATAAPASTSPATPSVTGATAVASAAPAAPVHDSAAPTAHRVTEQVFPEVARISASTVDGGPSRVTVKLNPEALGEVRIVLTSRRGELEISLAAGQDARRALVEGAPELHRLLESVGRADSRIVFRDLPGTTTVPSATPDGSPRTDVSTDLSGNAWSGAGRPGGEPAADRDGARHQPGSTNATDGTTSATPGSRPVTTTGRSHSGVDLTM